MAEFRNRECLFCHEDVHFTEDHPVNLAMVDHFEANPDCNRNFEGWTRHMADDFRGD